MAMGIPYGSHHEVSHHMNPPPPSKLDPLWAPPPYEPPPSMATGDPVWFPPLQGSPYGYPPPHSPPFNPGGAQHRGWQGRSCRVRLRVRGTAR